MSANSGDEIFNRAIVQGVGPDGSALTVERWSPGGLTGLAALANPSAAADVLNWTTSGSPTFTRDAAVFNSSPASFKVSASLAPWSVTSDSVAQPMIRFGRYALRIAMKSLYSDAYFSVRVLVDGVVVGSWSQPGNGRGAATSTAWNSYEFSWQQRFTGSGYQVQVFGTQVEHGSPINWDDVSVWRNQPTLADRVGFARTKILPSVQTAVTIPVANRVGDLFLAAHKTTPFRGSFTLSGQGGVRRVLGGSEVHPAHLEVGQLVRCTHRDDPDTGGWSRDARIASIQYDHDQLSASVALDDDRTGFDTLISRFSSVVGQRP